MMQPTEQGYQEKGTSQPYGRYTGTEQEQIPLQSPYYQEYHYGAGEWIPAEGMGGQQSQQQMYGQMPLPTMMRLLPEGRFAAVMSYSLGWFSGLVMLFFGWQNRFVRFHALQALFFFGAINIFDVISLRMMFFARHFLHGWFFLMICAFLLVNVIAAIAWIVGMIQAGMGNYYKLPVIGEIVQHKFVGPDPLK